MSIDTVSADEAARLLDKTRDQLDEAIRHGLLPPLDADGRMPAAAVALFVERRARFVSEAGDFRFERSETIRAPKREQQDKPPGED